MTPEELATAVSTPINLFGTTWMFDLGNFPPAQAAGYGVLDLYVTGRAGVNGAIPADEVVASIAIFEATTVTTAWERGLAIGPIDQAVELYAAACAAAGRARFEDVDAAGEAAELAGRVVDAADATAIPLFAGWRRLTPPTDPAGAAAHHFNGLRELRGSLHLNALDEVGLPALEAVVYRTGPNMAMLFGHQPPLPDVTDDVTARWRRAEDLTNAMIAPVFAVLSEPERERFAQLVDELLVAELPG